MRRRVDRGSSKRTGARALAIGGGLAVCSLSAQAQRAPSHEWLTWGGDIERTGWNRAESALSKKTVSQLALKWKTQIDKHVPIELESGASMLTGPLVAQSVRARQGTKTLAGENTLQRHTDPRYHEIYQKPGDPPLPRTGTMTAAERGQHTSRTVLYAFDAETGEELYSSKDAIDDWTHLSSITVVDGSVYVTTRQSFVYAFGLKK